MCEKTKESNSNKQRDIYPFDNKEAAILTYQFLDGLDKLGLKGFAVIHETNDKEEPIDLNSAYMADNMVSRRDLGDEGNKGRMCIRCFSHHILQVHRNLENDIKKTMGDDPDHQYPEYIPHK